MHMEELETFLVLAREKNFTKTAKQRALSQPTVSVHIKNLENEFATSLIQRTTKKVHLTAEGELFYNQGLKIWDVYEQLKETLYKKKQVASGLIRIGASFTIGEYILPSVIAQLQATHEQLSFHVTIGNTDQVINSVRRLEVDIGLVEGQTYAREVVQTPFAEDRLVIVCSPAYEGNFHSINDLHDQEWIIREEGSGTRQSFDHLIESHQMRVKSTFIISSTQGIKSSVKSGLGLALLSEATIQEELTYGLLKIVPIEGLYAKRAFSYILTKGTNLNRNTQLLVDTLKYGTEA
ncbi:LysR family transcriptional regulator [Cytobacillus sp. FSL R7-0696]|uniref:LysR family transcriptional regulator n=1 Tax=Cytobacillus sp. FSL R7-0696 TaxID=2921691 RepID=UPI0030FB19AD